ncbi:hypothetical protein IEQ34_009295 [Dendrobium chrysotoxum]|uniref:Uncharacterized protein n=1 Tax=Dendrobium chrysotoxum TaxID=161865 RepID=A0AAV7H2J0_DENCH|nr:hypothetical protein IEQ34_009295 [Dendrobium chrysotoxum]
MVKATESKSCAVSDERKSSRPIVRGGGGGGGGGGGSNTIGTYLNFAFAWSIAKKPTFLRLRGFETFRNREISTGAGAIRERLVDSDLRILTDISLVEWKELENKESAGNEWEDKKK